MSAWPSPCCSRDLCTRSEQGAQDDVFGSHVCPTSGSAGVLGADGPPQEQFPLPSCGTSWGSECFGGSRQCSSHKLWAQRGSKDPLTGQPGPGRSKVSGSPHAVLPEAQPSASRLRFSLGKRAQGWLCWVNGCMGAFASRRDGLSLVWLPGLSIPSDPAPCLQDP